MAASDESPALPPLVTFSEPSDLRRCHGRPYHCSTAKDATTPIAATAVALDGSRELLALFETSTWPALWGLGPRLPADAALSLTTQELRSAEKPNTGSCLLSRSFAGCEPAVLLGVGVATAGWVASVAAAVCVMSGRSRRAQRLLGNGGRERRMPSGRCISGTAVVASLSVNGGGGSGGSPTTRLPAEVSVEVAGVEIVPSSA